MTLSALNVRSDCSNLSNTYHFLTADSLRESRAAAGKPPYDAVVKFDTGTGTYGYENLQRHRAVLRAIAWFRTARDSSLTSMRM